MKKRIAAILILMMVLPAMLAVQASANGPGPMEDGTTSSAGGELFDYLLVSVCGLVLTVIAEKAIAWLFVFSNEQQSKVIWVNILSQILMRIGFVLVYPVHITSYPLAVALFEVLVYTGEFLVYGKLWKDVSVKKRLAFVCAANTVSLMLGLWVNRVLY